MNRFTLQILGRHQKQTPRGACCGVLLWSGVWLGLLVTGVAAAETDTFQRVIAPAFQNHCGKCHGAGDEIEGAIDLISLTHDRLATNADLVRKLIGVLDRQEMPPEEAPAMDAGLRESLIGELQVMLHKAVAQRGQFTHAPAHRMNRFQYNNSVTDLLEMKCAIFSLPEQILREHRGYFRPETGKMGDVVSVGNRPLGKSQLIEPRLEGVAAFPQDLRAEHGFDNRGDHLSLSPLLMESFLSLSESITQSEDFGPGTVGIWSSFFAAPAQGVDVPGEVRRRLEPFLTRAFRRPVDEETLGRYTNFAVQKLEAGAKFPDVMKSVAAATISSPRFLYLYDKAATTEAAEPIDNYELASRLSFFLWGSIPDQTLLDLAQEGRLKDPDVLDAQVTRMLRDRKLKRFCDSFPAQWLQLDRLVSSVPSREKYPGFYFTKFRSSMHMMLEPLLIFETVLIENQSIVQLIDSDFTYRSGHLERAYGELRTRTQDGEKLKVGEDTVLTFHRVSVSDRRNGGVITNAAVMTMTSGPERTQPITRGAWMATVIFNNPPEPPPADVPALDETPSVDEAHLTLRERLALHRERADCKGCHEKIDPLGFALENYDPIGRWRTTYPNGRDINVSGVLFRQHEFDNVVAFKEAILAEKDRFTRGLAGHLLSFGLTRQLGPADELALDKITTATKADGYRIQTLLRQIVQSEPFLTKTNPAGDSRRSVDSATSDSVRPISDSTDSASTELR